MKNKEKKPISFALSLLPLIMMLILLAVGYGYFKMRAEPILILSGIIAGTIAWFHGYCWNEMLDGIVDKIGSAMPATLILLSVGLLIGSWMFSGTIPMIIYYGVQMVNPKFLLVTAFIITAVVATVTGTSWGAVGTIGVALIGIATGLGVSLPATAGAVVAGAYFGDKISPLSDTTNLAPIAAGSELYEHIRHMLYTTIPAMIVSVIVYLIMGLNSQGQVATPENVQTLLLQLDEMFTWNILLILPAVFILFGSIKKYPTLPVMVGTAMFSVFLGAIIQKFSLVDGSVALVKGFNISMTGFEGEAIWDVTRLINRGGVNSVLGTMVLIFCAMGFAGIMSVSGMLQNVLNALISKVESTVGLILSTIASCVTVALVTGSSYLSILLPGEMFKNVYKERGLHAKNLSRTLEDSGTVIVPLVPWSAAGAYMAATLGVSTFEYLPYAVLNYTGIIFAILCAITGIGIAKAEPETEEAK